MFSVFYRFQLFLPLKHIQLCLDTLLLPKILGGHRVVSVSFLKYLYLLCL